jgi:(p)ppGpp synthase/HD superfamily hydrolase
VAVILTRYGRGDDTVVAGILHDVVADWVRDGYTREVLDQRIADKFGPQVLDMVLAVTYRRHDDHGVEMSSDDRKSDYLERLANASEEARWVCAADKLHNASTILADLRRTMDPATVWSRFSGGRANVVSWYRAVHERLRAVGFTAPIVGELDRVTKELEGME